MDRRLDISVAEAIVLGLIAQGVCDFFVVFGHGTTELGDVLRTYSEAGAVRCHPVRHETEAAHAATASRWMHGRRAAVVTSIGPGALHALAGSLVAASNGIGVWHLYGDETTEDEGPNMQQLPGRHQASFLRLASEMGTAYSLHTPGAVGAALRRGVETVEHPYSPGPFFLLLPMNTQGSIVERFNIDELPIHRPGRLGTAPPEAVSRAVEVLASPSRVVVKVGGGARGLRSQVERLLELADAVAVLSPVSSDVLDHRHPRNMLIGGSKGSSCGNHAMQRAETLVVIGSRGVCQADCSRTGYPLVRHVININADIATADHYQRTEALVGEGAATLSALCDALEGGVTPDVGMPSQWLKECASAKEQWLAWCEARRAMPTLFDDVWRRSVLTQPAAIDAIAAVVLPRGGRLIFDAGDVQANGFQMVAPTTENTVTTDGGSSYMGFASSALLARAVHDDGRPLVAVCGDGSFTMNPQVLIDGVALGVRGCIVVLDNRRMAAISSLQRAQYGVDFATSDDVAVDYVAWASSVTGVRAWFGGDDVASLRVALEYALAHDGVSLVHVPVYFGDEPLGGLGSYGRWNVGPWVPEVQRLRHEIAL